MAATTELIQIIDRQLRWLSPILIDLDDALDGWAELAVTDQLGWDSEWRSALLLLDVLRLRHDNNELTPDQERAYADIHRELARLAPRLRAAGLPLPS